jgi:DegV family protein with EDD domain
MKIKISADSTCDLPKEFVEKHNIGIFPLYIVTDEGKSYRDGIDITTPDVFAYTERSGKIAGTSAVTVTDYVERWLEWRQDCDAIVHIAFSSELSACCQNARLAAMDVPGVTVVDSLNLSTGYGHLVLDAALMAEAGVSAAEIAAETERQAPKMDVSFVLDTLDYLRRGGRCSALTALGANMLGLKPCLEMHDGKLGVAKKYRGKTDKAFLQYVTDRLKDRDDIDLRRVFITDSGIPQEVRQQIEDTVLACQPFKEVYHNLSGCTISGHCGPYCMGVLYYHK